MAHLPMQCSLHGIIPKPPVAELQANANPSVQMCGHAKNVRQNGRALSVRVSFRKIVRRTCCCCIGMLPQLRGVGFEVTFLHAAQVIRCPDKSPHT